MANAGQLYYKLGELDRAEEVLARAVELSPRVLPHGHPTVMHAANNLGAVMWDRGRMDRAEELFRLALELEIEVRGADHGNAITAMTNLANVLLELGRMEEAGELLERAVAARRATLGDRHPTTLTTLHNLAKFHLENGDRQAADPILRSVAETAREVLAPDDYALGDHLVELGRHELALRRYPEAEAVLLEAGDVYARALEPDHPMRLRLRRTLHTLYTLWGKPQLASAYEE